MEDLVGEPVRSIVKHLQDWGDIGYNLGSGISFENRVSALGEESAPRPTTPDGKRPRPDQICAYRDEKDSTRPKMAYFIEYKAPHKLTLPHLRLGLRPMDIYNDVVNRATIPVPEDKAARFQYHADKLAAWKPPIGQTSKLATPDDRERVLFVFLPSKQVSPLACSETARK